MTAASDVTHTFEAELIRPEGTGTWTYVEVPLDVSRALGARGRVAVVCTVTGASASVEFKGSLMARGGGRHFLVVAKPIRDEAGATTGDAVTVAVRRDTSERVVEVPQELAAALDENPAARDVYEGYSYSHRKEYATWVGEAKKSETRAARAAKAVAMLAEGKRLKA